MNSTRSDKNELDKPKNVNVDDLINAVRQSVDYTEMWLMTGLSDPSFDGVLLGTNEDDDVVLGDELVDGHGYLIIGLGQLADVEPGVYVLDVAVEAK